MNHSLFISDLHLQASDPATTERFHHFMLTQATQADALYILGDFFEVWIGDDNLTPFHQAIQADLVALTKAGVPVYIMHGNRDSLLGQRFMQQTGAQLLPDPSVINLYGKPTLLMHGDSLCTNDINYLRFRRLARNRIVQWLFLSLPLNLRKKIGQGARNTSKNHTMQLSAEIMDVTESAVQNNMQEKKVTLLIHGHTHKLNIHQHTLQETNQSAVRIVLGDWHRQGNALKYAADGHYEFIYF